MLVVAGVGREGEEGAGPQVVLREALLEGVEELAREVDGLDELVLVLRADQLDVLLEAELELEVALSG
jgi:hypothetical protein